MLEDRLNSLLGLAAIGVTAWRLPAAIHDGAWYNTLTYLVVVLATLVAVAIDLGLAVRAVRRSRRQVEWSESNERAVRKGARSDYRWSKTSFAVFALVPASLLVLVIKEAAQAALQDADEGRWWDAAYVLLTCGAVTGLWAHWKHVGQCFYQTTVDHARELSPLFVATALSKAAGTHPTPGAMAWDGTLEVTAAHEASRTLKEYIDRADLSKVSTRFEGDPAGVMGELLHRHLMPVPPRPALVARLLRGLGVGAEDRVRVAKSARAMLP
jgi:hypothetical protein